MHNDDEVPHPARIAPAGGYSPLRDERLSMNDYQRSRKIETDHSSPVPLSNEFYRYKRKDLAEVLYTVRFSVLAPNGAMHPPGVRCNQRALQAVFLIRYCEIAAENPRTS